MKRLFLDVGVSTGYALYDDRKLKMTGTVASESLERILVMIQVRDEPSEVIVEEPVLRGPGMLQTKLRDVLEIVHRVFPETTKCRPGEWKPWVKVHIHYPRGVFKSTHERDAVGMALWYLHTKHGFQVSGPTL